MNPLMMIKMMGMQCQRVLSIFTGFSVLAAISQQTDRHADPIEKKRFRYQVSPKSAAAPKKCKVKRFETT